MEAARIPLGDVTLNVLSSGEPSAPKMVFLHGFPEHAGAWTDMMTRFAATHRVIAPDQRGYGLSDKPEGVEAYATGKLAGDIIALIELVGGPVTLVGHDWGASVAYAVAMQAPERLSALIILNGVHPGPFQNALLTDAEQIAASQYIHFLRSAGAEAALNTENFAGFFRMLGALSGSDWLTEEMRTTYCEAWGQPGAVTAMLNWYRASPLFVPGRGETALERENPFADREKFRVRQRHLLIWGTEDLALRPAATEGLEDYCDELTRVAIPDADHWLVHSHPDRVAAEINAFLT